jgi:hypothetical protein
MTLLDDGNYLEKVIRRLSELYINERYKYLLLDQGGNYYTKKYPDSNPEEKYKSRPLLDYNLEYHLKEKYTIGVFAHPRKVKFICFDVDYVDIEKAKQVVTKLIDSLNSLGIDNDYINVSWSGNKGYHVEIFFVKPMINSVVHNFYKVVLNRAIFSNGEGGKVEFRPTKQQGVKLPLGANFKNTNMLTNKCWFVDFKNDFKMIRNHDYVFQIQQIEPKIIDDIVSRSYSEIQQYVPFPRFAGH